MHSNRKQNKHTNNTRHKKRNKPNKKRRKFNGGILMRIYNTTKIIIDDTKIINQHVITYYTKHIGNGNYIQHTKAEPIHNLNIKWI